MSGGAEATLYGNLGSADTVLRGGRLCQTDADRHEEIDPERFIRACSPSASEFLRGSSSVLSRLMPVASSQLLHARAAPEHERRIDFPAAASEAVTQHCVGAAEPRHPWRA